MKSDTLETHVTWAPNTVRAYTADFKEWEGFCIGHGFDVLPGDSDGLVAFVQSLVFAGRTLKVVERKTYAIGRIHEENGFENPVKTPAVQKVLMGAKLMLSNEPKRRRKLSELEAADLVNNITSDGASFDRDKALVLLIHATDLRTSEVSGLRWDDLSFFTDGLQVRIRKDVNRFRKNKNTYLFLPYSDDETVCVVRAMEEWNSNVLERFDSPVFRSINRHGHVSVEALSDVGIRWILKPLRTSAVQEA